MARDNEKKCLLTIKEALLKNNNIQIIHHHSSLDKFMFYVLGAKPNSKENDFPDFIFQGGGIEHFQITSSPESNRSGSSFMKERSRKEQDINNTFKNEIDQIDNNSNGNHEIHILQATETYNGFSYEAFLKSLERNIKKHADSLQKSSFLGTIIIFLMEQPTARMCLERDMFHAVFYLLSKDLKALRILKEHGKNVNFFAYLVADSLEVIDMSVIDSLIAEAKEYDHVDGGILIESSITNFFA